MQYTDKQLEDILKKHGQWLKGEAGGKRANLSYANLAHANLFGANLARANLTRANLAHANLAHANLFGANLAHANLFGANLAHANLSHANLSYANLAHANLSYANLFGANLTRANLSHAKGISKYRTTNLYLLADQPGKIRAYKLVNEKSTGPYKGGITYEIGRAYSVDVWDEDEGKQCGAGINLADLPWCMQRWAPGCRILIAEFTAEDIGCIPIASDGKFRVKRCTIVGEKDLVELGLASGGDK